MNQPHNDLSTLIGLISVLGLPLLGVLFSQKPVVVAITRVMLWVVNRLAQDKVERPSDAVTSGNNTIASQAIMFAHSESSKRVDSVEDDVAELRRQVRMGFDDVDKAIEKFGEQMRIRADGDLLINSRKFEAVNKRIDDLEHDKRDHDRRISELEDWRGGQ
jgi:predicted RNase H-like nuclease (RuvC/YqgF family)